MKALRLGDLRGQRVAVAMSGGVDSSVAAAIVHEAGAEVVGLSLRLYDLPAHAAPDARSCCAPEDLYDARSVAQALGIAHYVLDAAKNFAHDVIGDFVGSYLSGITPNPCVRCNERTKFRDLLHRARSLGCAAFVTGHYARIEESADETQAPSGSRLRLARAADARRDQSYFLFTLGQSELSQAFFPLGDLHKDEVRAYARARGLPVADKPDSQDICFVVGEKASDFVERNAPLAAPPNAAPREGEIIEAATGRVVGKHRGLHRYTVGQRHGLGVVGSQTRYVVSIDAARNQVVVGTKDEIYSTACRVADVRWSEGAPGREVRALVQVRSSAKAAPGVVALVDGQTWVRFETPVRAVAPGQAAVFYVGEQVLGGGWIAETLCEAAA